MAIAGTPTNVPFSGIWNGSLWTLQYEFVCYLILGAMAVAGLLRRRFLVLVLTMTVWAVASYFTYSRTWFRRGALGFDEARLLGFVPLFLAGALLYLYRDRIPDSGWLAAGCTALFIASLWLPFGTSVIYALAPSFTAAVVSSVFLAYPMIWLGIHLPFHRVGAHNDYSYGTYIYAMPLQQLLATWNIQRWGMPLFMTLSVGVTMPFAVASWWIVEKRFLKLRRIFLPQCLNPTRLYPLALVSRRCADYKSFCDHDGVGPADGARRRVGRQRE